MIPSVISFLEDVKKFYEQYDRGDVQKFILIQQTSEEIQNIAACNECEHAFRILSIRRLLASTMPHFGYEERIPLDADLNKILTHCREHLKITSTNSF